MKVSGPEDFTENLDAYLNGEREVESSEKSAGKRSARSLFGMFRHRAPDTPVSIEKMETAIRERIKRTGV